MSEKRNSWARRTLLKLGKRASKSPFTKVGKWMTKGPVESIKLDSRVRNIMIDKGWGEGAIGRISNTAIAKKLKDYYKNNDEEGANNYIKEQEEKMSNQ